MNRKRKVAYLPYESIINGFLTNDKKITNLPADAKVKSVFIDYTRDAIGFLVESDEFDDVPVGQSDPEFVLALEFKGNPIDRFSS